MNKKIKPILRLIKLTHRLIKMCRETVEKYQPLTVGNLTQVGINSIFPGMEIMDLRRGSSEPLIKWTVPKQLVPYAGVRAGRAPSKNSFSIPFHLLRSPAEEEQTR